MRNWIALVLWLVTLPVFGASPDRSARKLRSLALLPSLSVSFAISFNEVQEPELTLGTDELRRRIQSLRHELHDHPNDADRWFRLGRCLDAADLKAEANDAYRKSVEFFRNQAQGSLKDAPLRARFAEALQEAGKQAEAEHVLRSTLKIVPDSWDCWLALGDLLDQKGLKAIYTGNGPAASGPSLLKQLEAELAKRPSADQVEEAEACRIEADHCFDRAVALAPKEPRVFIARALHCSGAATIRQLVGAYRGLGTMEPKDMMDTLSSDEACADWAQASRLDPTNETVIACWGWSEAMPGIINNSGLHALENLPRSRREHVLEAMRLLEDLAEFPSPKIAAGALEALGILKVMVTLEPASAKAAFRRAVALDPSRKTAWQGVVATAIMEEDPRALVSACEDCLKHDDTALNRVKAAKACDRANLPEKAMAHARAAVKLDPKDPLTHLCLGALLLRHADDEPSALETKQHLAQTLALLPKVEDKDERAKIQVVCGLDAAIVMALDGETEKARDTLRKIAEMKIAVDKVKTRVKEVLTLLGE